MCFTELALKILCTFDLIKDWNDVIQETFHISTELSTIEARVWEQKIIKKNSGTNFKMNLIWYTCLYAFH